MSKRSMQNFHILKDDLLNIRYITNRQRSSLKYISYTNNGETYADEVENPNISLRDVDKQYRSSPVKAINNFKLYKHIRTTIMQHTRPINRKTLKIRFRNTGSRRTLNEYKNFKNLCS